MFTSGDASGNNLLRQRQIFRFVVGTTLSMAMALGINWPLAFITPLFVSKFLGNSKPCLPLKAVLGIFLCIALAFIFAKYVPVMLYRYQVLFVLLMSLILFRLFYWYHSGGSEFATTMMLMGIVIVPLIDLIHPGITDHFINGFLFSCALAMVFYLLMHYLMPDPSGLNNPDNTANTAADKGSNPDKRAKDTSIEDRQFHSLYLTKLSLLIVLPLYFLFFYFQLSGAILILAFVCILAMQPSSIVGIKGAKALIIGNVIGGVAALVFFYLLIAVPSFWFLILLSSLVSIIFGQRMISEHASAPLYAMAFTTIIILVSSSVGAGEGGLDKFLIRIMQILIACGYLILTLGILERRFRQDVSEDKSSELANTSSASADI